MAKILSYVQYIWAHGTYRVLLSASNILVNNFNSVKKVISFNFFTPQLLHPTFRLTLFYYIIIINCTFYFHSFLILFFSSFFLAKYECIF